jgi:hypothetical protein
VNDFVTSRYMVRGVYVVELETLSVTIALRAE